jgi:hypothetical protein
MNLRGADALGRREIKRVEGFHLREAGLAQALTDHRLVPRGQLRAQHFLQVVFVGPVRVAGLPREAFKDAGHAGQLQRAGVSHDKIARQGRGAHTASASQPS